jgi:hypothetical protein
MPLPESYRRFLRITVRYALVMLAAGLLAGISFQESGRKLTLDMAPAGAHLEFLLVLAMVHGHAILLGCLLPLAMAGMLLMGLRLGAPPVPDRALAWSMRLAYPGIALSVLLMLAKGYWFVLGARFGALDLGRLDKAFLGHPALLRAALFGAAHLAMGLGLGILGLALWRALSRPSSGQAGPSMTSKGS